MVHKATFVEKQKATETTCAADGQRPQMGQQQHKREGSTYPFRLCTGSCSHPHSKMHEGCCLLRHDTRPPNMKDVAAQDFPCPWTKFVRWVTDPVGAPSFSRFRSDTRVAALIRRRNNRRWRSRGSLSSAGEQANKKKERGVV